LDALVGNTSSAASHAVVFARAGVRMGRGTGALESRAFQVQPPGKRAPRGGRRVYGDQAEAQGKRELRPIIAQLAR